MKLGWQQDGRCQDILDETPEHAETADRKEDCRAKEGTTGFSKFGEKQSIISALVRGRGVAEWKVVTFWLYLFWYNIDTIHCSNHLVKLNPGAWRVPGYVSRRCGGLK